MKRLIYILLNHQGFNNKNSTGNLKNITTQLKKKKETNLLTVNKKKNHLKNVGNLLYPFLKKILFKKKKKKNQNFPSDNIRVLFLVLINKTNKLTIKKINNILNNDLNKQ